MRAGYDTGKNWKTYNKGFNFFVWISGMMDFHERSNYEKTRSLKNVLPLYVPDKNQTFCFLWGNTYNKLFKQHIIVSYQV